MRALSIVLAQSEILAVAAVAVVIVVVVAFYFVILIYIIDMLFKSSWDLVSPIPTIIISYIYIYTHTQIIWGYI